MQYCIMYKNESTVRLMPLSIIRFNTVKCIDKYTKCLMQLYTIPTYPGSFSLAPAKLLTGSCSPNEYYNNMYGRWCWNRDDNQTIHAYYRKFDEIDDDDAFCRINDKLMYAAMCRDQNLQVTVLIPRAFEDKLDVLNYIAPPDMHI